MFSNEINSLLPRSCDSEEGLNASLNAGFGMSMWCRRDKEGNVMGPSKVTPEAQPFGMAAAGRWVSCPRILHLPPCDALVH